MQKVATLLEIELLFFKIAKINEQTIPKIIELNKDILKLKNVFFIFITIKIYEKKLFLEEVIMSFYEIIILISKTIFSYIFLLIILKIMGKREMSQVSIFDLVIFLIMSELFSLALNDIDSSILHFVIPVIIIVILELVSAFISMKSIKVRNFLEGKVSFIIYKGEIDYLEMKKNRFNISDLMLQLRNKDIQSPIEVEFAILEGNGILNVIKKKDLLVEYPDPLIIDGKVNDEALKKLSLNENFLYSELSKLNYTSPSQIFFAQYLKDGLFIVPFK